ncbi:MAG: methionyl-tRNA formyltransferase [Candidatus Moranbacteria bacterium]|nr:methionyl-tRNA formyltransferase [Candidatus Moranbacteria bacterium]
MNWLSFLRKKPSTSSEEVIPEGDLRRGMHVESTPKVRIVFMGTPSFAATLLETMISEKYNVVGVVTKQDKTIGRSQEIAKIPVKEVALKYSLPILQPVKLDETAIATLSDWKPDLIVVAAYGKILPPSILSLPGFGCVNVHASLLPRFRGASPIQNTLLSGDTETGVTLMLMDEGMDTGDIIAQKKISIDANETKENLLARLTEEGKALLRENIPLWVLRKITPTSQDESQATLCQLIEREDGRVIWNESAKDIYNRYRALTPWPGIFTFWKKSDGEFLRLKLHRVSLQKQSVQTKYPLGQVMEIGEKIGVQTGEGVIFLEEVQLEGKNKMPIKEFLLGNDDLLGGQLQ